MKKTQFNTVELETELYRLRSENSLLKERLQRINGTGAAIFYLLDSEGYFVFVNRAVEDILQFTPEDLIGKHFSTIMPREEYEKVSRVTVLPKYLGKVTGVECAPKLFDERRTGARKTNCLEVRLLTKNRDGKKFLLGDVTGIIAVEGLYDAAKVIDCDNRADAFMGSQGVIFDITRYKKAEKERMELQKHLYEVQKSEALGKLASKVAHDLNNKIGSILGCAEIINQDIVLRDEKLRMYVETIISASKNAADLSKRLMEFSKRDDRRMVELSLHGVIENILRLVKSTVESSITVMTNLDAKEQLVEGNSCQIQNIILNIVTNACDAMAFKGGNLKFATFNITFEKETQIGFFQLRSGRYVVLSISDTGTGMDKNTLKHLFQPFFTTKAVGKGIGLGMTSVRDCIRAHGGSVEVNTSLGEGSTFNLYFPLSEKQF